MRQWEGILTILGQAPIRGWPPNWSPLGTTRVSVVRSITGFAILLAMAATIVTIGQHLVPVAVAVVILIAISRDVLVSVLLTLLLFDGSSLFPDLAGTGQEEQWLKALALLVVLLLLATKGWRRGEQVVPTALAIASLVPWLGVPLYGPLSASVPRQVIGLSMLAVPWLLASLRLSERSAIQLLASIASLPIVGVIVGMVNWLAGSHLPWRLDFGVYFRLQGTLAPALLGLLAACGVLACVVLIIHNRIPVWVISFPLAISILTGTRGAVLFCLLLIVSTIAGRLFKETRFVAVLLGLVVAVGAIFAVIGFNSRADNSMGSSGLTGRAEAWSEYVGIASQRPLTGHGVGATAGLEPSSAVHESFVLPHNEFVHFWLDFGIFGSLIVWLAIGRVWRTFATGLRLKPWSMGILFLAISLYAFVDNTFTSLQFLMPLALTLAAASALSRGPTRSVKVA